MRKTTSPTIEKQELLLSRIIDAPPQRVFEAWTNPTHLAQWWGPNGFTNPVCEMDARPEGDIRIDMTGPDGVVYPMSGVFHEVSEPERLVFTSAAFPDEDENPQLEVLNTVTFEEFGAQTELKLRAVVTKSSPATAQALAGMEEGWTQSLDRLEEFVQKA